MLIIFLLSGCAGQQPDTPTEPTASPTGPKQAIVEADEDYLFVHFIDVGQADCSLLRLGDLDILIDGGNVADGRAVVDYLNFLGVDDIELMISTHAHEDHAGGLSFVLKQMEAEQVWVTTDHYSTAAYTSFIQAVRAEGLPVYIPSVGEIFEQDGVTVTVLGPLYDYSAQKDNNTSIVVMVQYGEIRFLFTGDMETLAESDLLASGADLSADVLKVGHHGSYTSSSEAFLEAVGAQFGIIHVGRDNEYGHPHDAAMKRLTAAGLTLYRTDLCGSIVIGTDGSDLAFAFTDSSGIN